MKTLLRYFIQGLFYTVPLGVTIYVVFISIRWLDDLIPMDVPGLGILIIILLIVFIGYMGSVVLSSQLGFLVKIFEKVILRIPLVKMLYTSLKDIVSALMGSNRSFDEAVLVTLDKENDIRKLGFVTNDDLSSLGIAKDMVAVYFPYSYGIMGDLRIVPKDQVKPVKGKATDIMKFIVSAGMVQLEDKD